MPVKKSVCILLLLITLCCTLIANAQETAHFTMMGLEYGDSNRIWDESQFFQRMQERTGVSFSFTQYTEKKDFEDAKKEAFTSGGELPDVLFKADLSPTEEMDYLQRGLLVDLAPYLAEYAPNVSQILDAREDWRSAITQPNGAIASLPVLRNNERQSVVWIHQGWLTSLGLSMPQNIDEYTEVLRAFRDGDPNGNGKPDEIPLYIIGPWEAKFLLHAFGIVANDYNIYVDDTGTVAFAPFDPAYRDFIEWLHMAQQESLINADAFRMMHASQLNSTQTDEEAPLVYGGMISIAPYTIVDLDNTTDYAVLPPLARDGKQAYRQLLTGVGRGTFAVTNACDDVGAALRWVDFLYTEEGGRLAYAGLENEDYSFSENGTWAWNTGEDYSMLSELLARVVIADEARTPGLEPAGFMRNTQIEADNHVRKQMDTLRDLLVNPFPVTWPTDAAREERIAALQATLAACVDVAIANFAMGKTELNDETWQAFQEELHALGADEFLSLWQQKYDELGDAV